MEISKLESKEEERRGEEKLNGFGGRRNLGSLFDIPVAHTDVRVASAHPVRSYQVSRLYQNDLHCAARWQEAVLVAKPIL